ncbi:DDHD domain protein [Xylariales sp. AK1849]|nr:DDHD domain protein [Xylariales sp. AK1849]
MNPEDHALNGATTASPVRDIKMASDNAPMIKSSEASKPSTPITPLPATQLEDLQTKVFKFLSTATAGTLGAIAAGLAAVTYFILGQVGLLLIGAFAGISLFVSWEARHPEVSRAVRGEKGYDFLDRLFDTKGQTSDIDTEQDEEIEAQALARSFDDFQPETREALNSLVDAVVRDYVDWWYGPIVPSDKSFPLSCRKVLTSFLLSISNQLSRKRPADAFVDFLTNTCSIIIVFFSEMTAAHASVPSDNTTTATDAIYSYLATNSDSSLANLLNTRQQAGKLKMIAEDLLGFLDRPTYDCDPARIFLREILATTILDGTLQTCSKPEWINGWIVYLLESGETDLSQAIDEAIQDQKAFADVDGNFGNISLSKGNRNSYEMDRVRKKEMTHKKKLSKADEEMERAMEEMKKMNAMIAEAEKVTDTLQNQQSEAQASGLLINALNIHSKDLDLKADQQVNGSLAAKAPESSVPEAKNVTAEVPIDRPASKEGSYRSPITPRSTIELSSQNSSPYSKQEATNSSRFTSFDQIVPPAQEELEEEELRRPPPLTMHNATITVHDDPGNEKGRLRSKPTWEYLVQIEPASSHHPGWMIMKTYPQFESLHESLRRIAAISGANAFLEAHATFASWKLHTRSSLRGEIERYLRAACSEKPLAESEAMRRFLEKGQDARMGVNRGFSFESVGKGMLGVVQNAPKGVFDGGKVVVGGVTGVLGNIGLGQRKSTMPSASESPVGKPISTASSRPLSLSALPRMDTAVPMRSRDSLDSQRSSIISTQPGKMPQMERRPSYQLDFEQDGLQPTRSDRWEPKSLSAASSRGNSRASSMAALRSPLRSPSDISLSNMRLPPPPDAITDDYESPVNTRPSSDAYSRTDNNGLLSPQTSFSSPSRSHISHQPEKSSVSESSAKRPKKQYPPLSEQETRVAVELLFAVINELYTLSSAWNIRRTLLTAAKSFLIRPGNPSLVSIQTLIQDSVLETNVSDTGIAGHLKKIRENSLPTEEERKAWPAELTAEEKEELRVKARKLFIQSGVPAALMGIMGQSATSEALGRVFDCLQIEEVARGLFFGVMLQAVRVVTH